MQSSRRETMMVCCRTGNLAPLMRWGLLFASLGGFAQSQPAQLQPVTIQQAVAEAVDKNLNVLAEKYSVPIAEARILTARLRPNPVLSVEGDHLNLLPPKYNAENMGGPPEYSIRTDFVFERGAKRQRRIDVAEAAVSTAQLQFLNTVRSVVLDVQSAFVELLQAKADLALAEETLESFRQTVQINTNRVRSGDLAEVELIRTQVAELQFENTVAQARLKVEVGRSKLQVLLGRRKTDKVPDAAGEFRRDEPAISVDALREKAFASRPDYLALLRDVARSLAELRLQLAQGIVDYTIGTEYRRQQGLAGRGNSIGIFFSSNLPVFNRNQGEIERARQERSQAEARIRAIQATIENEVETAWLQYQTARESLRRVEESMLAKATDVRQITDRAYRRGAASFLDFLDAQRAYNDTVQIRNAALGDFAKSLYTIDAATGANTGGLKP
jgi:cobalt-zinc-cadmium efflux system outer membrane protein